MKRIFFGITILVLSLPALMWLTSPVSGSSKGHSGGRAPSHVGSVHYASRPAPAHRAPVHTAPVHPAPVRTAPARVAPARVAHTRPTPGPRTGSVRAEHYAGSSSRGGGYRNPYRDDYFRHFRPGYSPYVIDGTQYYGYDELPPDCQMVVINGITYYLYDGVYYQAYLYDGQTVYLAVPTQ